MSQLVCLGVLLCAVFGPVGAVHATTWVVDQGGGGDFTTIQAAIAAAATGDEIVVQPGTYVENLDCVGKNLNVRSAQGAAVTTIDGSAGAVGSASCVTYRNGENTTAVLEGFSIVGGLGTQYNGRLEMEVRDTLVGGGVYCDGASPRIVNCVFSENACTYAAGVFVDQADPQITGCTFIDNTAATYGGAIAGPGSSPTIQNCLFEGNYAGAGDGTIHLALPCEITDCVFRNNEARAGAAINSGGVGADFHVARCIFEGNIAHETHGGAIRVHEASPIIEDCLFVGNHAALDGGALMDLDGGGAIVQHCTFFGNHAGRDGGQIAALSGADPQISHCILAAGDGGGGAYCSGASPAFTCNDVWANAGGNYLGCDDPTGTEGNISADPLFCAPEEGDFNLQCASPCAPGNNPACGLVGVYPVACGVSPAEAMTWGAIKATFRK
jgi:predicted outer membrane repeat protein